MKNIRFWAYVHNGWVKITLKPYQTLTHHYSYRHDEGRSYEAVKYTYEAKQQIVLRDWINGGTDCDGPCSQSGIDSCPVDQLHAIVVYKPPLPTVTGSHAYRNYRLMQWFDEWSTYYRDGIEYDIHSPDWKSSTVRCFDKFAEDMNY